MRDGLRKYAEYRDLGMAKATGGMVQAHIVRIADGVDPAAIKQALHYHDVQFQMVFILKGWMLGEYEGHGQHMMREGSCWLQPPRIVHKVLDQSKDLQVLEIIMPADFPTVDV